MRGFGDAPVVEWASGGSSKPCFVEGTKITLANGKTKNVEDITYDDKLLVYNFDEGKLDIATPAWIMQEQTTNIYYKSTFDNGTELCTVGTNETKQAHRMFNKEQSKFVYLSESINDTAYTLTGDSKLIKYETITAPCKYYNIITKQHFNVFANGILTSNRFNNMYEIENMKYKKVDRNIDLTQYEGLPEDMIIDFRLNEQNVNKCYLDRLLELKK